MEVIRFGGRFRLAKRQQFAFEQLAAFAYRWSRKMAGFRVLEVFRNRVLNSGDFSSLAADFSGRLPLMNGCGGYTPFACVE